MSPRKKKNSRLCDEWVCIMEDIWDQYNEKYMENPVINSRKNRSCTKKRNINIEHNGEQFFT